MEQVHQEKGFETMNKLALYCLETWPAVPDSCSDLVHALHQQVSCNEGQDAASDPLRAERDEVAARFDVLAKLNALSDATTAYEALGATAQDRVGADTDLEHIQCLKQSSSIVKNEDISDLAAESKLNGTHVTALSEKASKHIEEFKQLYCADGLAPVQDAHRLLLGKCLGMSDGTSWKAGVSETMDFADFRKHINDTLRKVDKKELITFLRNVHMVPTYLNSRSRVSIS